MVVGVRGEEHGRLLFYLSYIRTPHLFDTSPVFRLDTIPGPGQLYRPVVLFSFPHGRQSVRHLYVGFAILFTVDAPVSFVVIRGSHRQRCPDKMGRGKTRARVSSTSGNIYIR